MCGLPYFIVFRGIGQTDETIDVGMRTLSFSPACAAWPHLQGEGGAGRRRLRERDGFHRRKAGLCARSEFGCGRVRRSAGMRLLRVA